jgi:competence protein ComEC
MLDASSRYVKARLVGLVAIVLAAPIATIEAQQTMVVRETVSSCLVVRARPASDSPRRGCLAPGTQVTAIASAPYWRRIVLPDGKKGWAAKQHLAMVTAPADQPAPADPDRWLEVHFVDVGQGDGIWIRTPDDGLANGRFEGRSIVIDGGPDRSDAANAIYRYMSAIVPARTPIDALIVTHPHDDHYPGAQGLLTHYPVRDIYDSGFPKTGTKWGAFMAEVRRSESAGARVHRGRDTFGTLDWGSELTAEVLHAWPGVANDDDLGRNSTLENNTSIVLKLTYGQVSFLFMGDAEGKERADSPDTPQFAEARLLQDPSKLKATVLKIAHHGSETSSTLPFIQAVDPDYVVVMSGRRKYGQVFLPDASTLRRYCSHKPTTRILRTDQDDEEEGRTQTTDADQDHVVIKTNGTRLVVETYSNGRRIDVEACAA